MLPPLVSGMKEAKITEEIVCLVSIDIDIAEHICDKIYQTLIMRLIMRFEIGSGQ